MSTVRDEDRDDGRIEIELVEHAPARRRARKGSGEIDDRAETAVLPATPPVPAPDSAGPPGDDRIGRRTVLAIAGGLGVAGLLVGWAVGRAGDDPAIATPPSEVAPATTPPPASFADDPALVEPDAAVITEPPTTRVRPTTTSVPPVQVISPIPDVDRALIGLPYEIVSGDVSGDLHFVDLASDTLTIVDGRRGVDIFYLGDDWTLLPNGAPRSNVLYDGDTEVVLVEFDPWSVMHATGSATLWRPDNGIQGLLPFTMVEIDETGEPTGQEVDVPRYPMMVEADGTFLVDGPGGVYTVSERGTERLSAGELIAVGPAAALVNECDAAFACQYVTVNRETGERTVLSDSSLADQPLQPAAWWSNTAPAVSPDGSLAIVLVSVGTSGVVEPATVDLATGATTPIASRIDPWLSGASWTDDSQFAFFMSSGELFAWSRATGEVLRAGPDETSTQRPQSFHMRPSDGTPWSDR